MALVGSCSLNNLQLIEYRMVDQLVGIRTIHQTCRKIRPMFHKIHRMFRTMWLVWCRMWWHNRHWRLLLAHSLQLERCSWTVRPEHCNWTVQLEHCNWTVPERCNWMVRPERCNWMVPVRCKLVLLVRLVRHNYRMMSHWRVVRSNLLEIQSIVLVN